ncbi:SDR family NAD(P)-dependent oxidoreductase [Wohlfahrtiimonas chitiniclastica]|uniref:SDR family NAD(P)-dependent oxidoreductase n=1 Tax=Wohlfahrtiimonas chitiniclastica TaxID=400946 RepID=UPI00036A6F76|nr:SDR family NAD(P)-dependent oxidoreductase [Wohlfahrtiimonas chitiniclastica]MBS7837044.1 SDR family NAD(P)-dependent oxidoreductase [Wohlfahrtiimonas chitiniclastica]
MNVVITGVSAGFGQEMARVFAAHGHHVIGIARRTDRLAALKAELNTQFTGFTLDVADRVAATQVVDEIIETFGQVDILINNAGLALGMETADQANFEDWATMVNTNVMGLISLTQLFLPHMVAKNDGYIINMGSTAGSWPYAGGNVYGATKAFVKQFSLNLRADLFGKRIRVTNVEPGLCGETEFSNVRFKGDDDKAAALYDKAEPLTGKDIAEIVFWLANQPKHININRIEVMPTSQSFAGLKVHYDD